MDWNTLDKFIGYIRYIVVDRYVVGGQDILDVGCGREAAFLMRHKEKVKTGIGLDYRILDREVDNIKLINNMHLESFPLDDESIDTIFLNAVLEHLPNPYEVLSECKRVLRSNGIIVMTTPTRISKPVLEFMAFKLHVINEDEIREHQHYYNKKDIIRLADMLNMRLERYSFFEVGFNSIIVLSKGNRSYTANT